MRIKELRESRNIQQKELASILGISPNTLSQYENKKREPSKEVISQIADYFNVSTDFIYEITDTVNCEDCGLSYNPLVNLDINVHDNYHKRWHKAVLKYGKIYSNTGENERIKQENRNKVKDLTLPVEDRVAAQLQVFRCLFSRSLSACNYSDKHINFNDYVATMLNNTILIEEMGKDVYELLVKEYGTSETIPSGTSYYIERNSSNHADFPRHILAYYSRLTKSNKEKAEGYIHSLFRTQEFESLLPNAAHERTDIEITDEMKKHDDDIMDDENF